MDPLLNKTWELFTQNRENAEVLNVFSSSVFTSQTNLQESQIPKTTSKVWSKEDVVLMEEYQVREYLSELELKKVFFLYNWYIRRMEEKVRKG